MELYEWSKHHIKFKDCMKKQILNIECKDSEIHVQEKKQELIYYINEELEEGIKKIQDSTKEIIITLNTKKNFETLIKSWSALKTHTQLSIIFTHPEANETWVIRPYTHDKISDNDKLKEGLEAIFSNVRRV
jgi:hypothetical protein